MKNMPNQLSSLVFLHYLTTVFDNIAEAILLIDIEPRGKYRLLMANAAYTRITGRGESPIGQLLSDYLLPETYAAIKKNFAKVVTTKKVLNFTGWYDVPIGKQAYEIQLIPILNAVGQCVQIATIMRNVTELCRLREENEVLKKQRKDP